MAISGKLEDDNKYHSSGDQLYSYNNNIDSGDGSYDRARFAIVGSTLKPVIRLRKNFILSSKNR